MATLRALANDGTFERIEVDLDDGKQPWRCLYGTPEFVEWLGQTLPTLETGIMGAEMSPEEQVYALFADFIEGSPLEMDRRFRSLRYTPDLYVWELKTIDVRIFGWFAKMDHFICTFGEFKDGLDLSRYGRCIARTSFIREKCPLDEPKFVEFKEYDNVLSDAD